ncbi:MAG: tRNA (cytidine(34)-2'-O)-methyltransferase [Proteobacteria bacterium]|nr:tRNA (cytidine(34)-2'-O)-methyltransferase [Pseudomonadota bacterium]
MKKDHVQICLYQPEIPQNTGSIGRLAAATSCRLHLIKPFGFGTSDKNLRRPGLDYWPFLDLEIHDNIEGLIEAYSGRIAFFSKFASQTYDKMPKETEVLVFGRETSGFPPEFHERFAEHFYRIPMFHPHVRSLNLANACSIVVYDLLQRRGLFV